MATAEVRSLRVAAVQMESRDGAIEENLRRATEFIDQAAASGARLILLPEFMPTGYQYTNAIWDAGEPADGPTVSWLKESSNRLNAWIDWVAGWLHPAPDPSLRSG